MTTASFARLETRVNEAAMRHLFNAEAVGLDENGQQVQIPVIFDAPASLGSIGSIGMAGSQPTILMADAGVLPDPVGWALTIKGVSYVVAAHEPDGTGVSRLLLERAA